MNHDYEASYIPGPKGELQETHLGSREMLNAVRDGFDLPLAKFFSSGSAETSTPPLAELLFTTFSQDRDKYVVEGHLDALTLIADALPRAFAQAIQEQVFDLKLAKRIFDIAGSEGIDTAISYVFNAAPFIPPAVNDSGKLNVDNDRFKNGGLTHPETGEPLYKICPGFRVAQAIERQLVVGLRRILTDSGVKNIDTTIPPQVSVGDLCKALVNSYA